MPTNRSDSTPPEPTDLAAAIRAKLRELAANQDGEHAGGPAARPDAAPGGRGKAARGGRGGRQAPRPPQGKAAQYAFRRS